MGGRENANANVKSTNFKPNSLVNGQKTLPPPLPSISFLGLSTPMASSPSARRRGEGGAMDGIEDVQIQDANGDEDVRGRPTLVKRMFFLFSPFFFFRLFVSKSLN